MPDEEGAYRWLWYATFACGCIALALCVAYYLRRSDISIFDTFQKPDGPSLNGHGPEAPAEVLDDSQVE
jgi:hypothetical protein